MDYQFSHDLYCSVSLSYFTYRASLSHHHLSKPCDHHFDIIPRFERHMRQEHEMYSDQLDFVLSIHFLSDSEKTRLRERMRKRVERVRALHNTAGDVSSDQTTSEMRKNSRTPSLNQDNLAIVPEQNQDSPVENMLTQELFKLLQGKNTEDILSVTSLEEKVAEQLDIRTEAQTGNLEDIKPGVMHVDGETRSKAVFVKCRVCLKKVRKDMLERHKRVKHNGKRFNEKINHNTTNFYGLPKVGDVKSKIPQNIKREVVEEAGASELLTTKRHKILHNKKRKPWKTLPIVQRATLSLNSENTI